MVDLYEVPRRNFITTILPFLSNRIPSSSYSLDWHKQRNLGGRWVAVRSLWRYYKGTRMRKQPTPLQDLRDMPWIHHLGPQNFGRRRFICDEKDKSLMIVFPSIHLRLESPHDFSCDLRCA